MGIFINLDVAYNVSDDEWEPVYEESLYLAKKFKLMDFHELELFGDQLYCGVPVEEQAEADERFWSTIGDYETMGRAEYQRLYRKLGNYQSEQETGKCYDPLLSIAPSQTMLDWEDERCRNCYSFWGNKTQGEAYHMYLLAIGCMIESRLNGKACVSGDITLGQCRKAVDLANQYLREPIGLPVQCDLEHLYRRIRALPLKGAEPLNVLQRLYLGKMDRDYGEFVNTHFSKEERIEFWRREFEHLRIGTIGFSSSLKEYFNLGNDLEELCDIVNLSDEEGKKDYDGFIKEIMSTNLYLEDKDLRDCLEIDRESESPYTIYTLMAQFAFAGAANYSVDAYMPIEKIREILCRKFGGLCDVPNIIDEYMKNKEEDKEENPPGILNDFIDTAEKNIERDLQSYDICEIRDLLYYEPGDKLKPVLEETCIKYITFYKKVCEEEHFADLMKKSSEDKCAFLVHQNKYLFLMKNRWFEIFDEIKENPECFRRYYPMVRVKLDDTSCWLVYAYVVNDDFYRYCEEMQER